MTATNATPAADNADHDTGPEEPAGLGTLQWADPATLILGPNVRGEVVLDPHFARDIRDRGVREPIIVRRRAGADSTDEVLVVRKGKRRTLAAVKAGLPRVRVLVEDEPDVVDDDRGGHIDRIVDQLGENVHRAGNTEAEEVRAHQELLDLGLTAGQIARRTHQPTGRVRALTTVARSALASAVLERYALSLDQVGVIAEFDDGSPDGVEAVKLLTVTAETTPAQFPHVAQRLRLDREDRQLRAAAAAELADTGVRILTDEDSAADTAAPLTSLRPTAQDPDGTALTDQAHASCPGHAVELVVRRPWNGDTTVETVAVCTDPTGNGHTPRWSSTATPGRPTGPMSEQDKAERRRVIKNNKEWDAAAAVRRTWLTEFLARRSAPKDAQRYITTTLARGSHDLRKAFERANATAATLLGLTAPESWYSGKPNPIAVLAATAPAARLPVLTLAILLGAAEDATGRHSWRRADPDTRAYFTALTSWGYPLSDVEQLVLTDPTSTDSDDPPHPEPTDSDGADSDRADSYRADSDGADSDGADSDSDGATE